MNSPVCPLRRITGTDFAEKEAVLMQKKNRTGAVRSRKIVFHQIDITISPVLLPTPHVDMPV